MIGKFALNTVSFAFLTKAKMELLKLARLCDGRLDTLFDSSITMLACQVGPWPN